jgi:F-type H+-transporting ATPase subunit a
MEDLHVEVAPEVLGRVSIPGTNLELMITNSFFTMLIVMGLLLLVGTLIARRATLVPGHIQAIFEVMADFMLRIVESAAGPRSARRIFPLVGSLFIFILFANYSGLLPGVGTIWMDPENVGEHIPILRPPSADLNMTIAMALVTFTVVQIAGIGAHGVVGRIKHLAQGPLWLAWLLFLIELISEFSRIISLSFRLFGNVFAGEVLLGVMYTIANIVKISVIGLLIPVVFLYLEVLFGFIQALVFALLTMIYIVLATAHHGDEEHPVEHEAELAEEEAQEAPARAGAGGD